jgi:hypothetical protein
MNVGRKEGRKGRREVTEVWMGIKGLSFHPKQHLYLGRTEGRKGGREEGR